MISWKSLVKEFSNFYPIRGKNALLIAERIISLLEENSIIFEIQKFTNYIPFGRSKLEVDGREIDSMAASFVSGKIDEKNIISNVISSSNIDDPNISFNPYSKTFSLASFYFVPSINVKRSDVQKIISAETIKGKVKVKKERIKAINIIIGNTKNPTNIIISHYDTVLNGAVDNTSGIVTILDLILHHKEKILEKNLFVLCGSEEFSYEKPIYWGYGYRKFEKEYEDLLSSSRRIFVVDCVGFDKVSINRDISLLYEALPLSNFNKYKNKISLVTSISEKNIKYFFSFYHSNLDIPKLLKEEYINQSKRLLLKGLVK